MAESDDEWDEAAAKAAWERGRTEYRAEHPDVAPIETTWEEVRGFHRAMAIGKQWERDVEECLHHVGVATAHRWSGDIDDWRKASQKKFGHLVPPPDIAGIDGWTVECKNRAKIRLAQYVDQMCEEKQVTGDRFGVVIVKRRDAPVEDAYAVMRLEDWATYVAEHQ